MFFNPTNTVKLILVFGFTVNKDIAESQKNTFSGFNVIVCILFQFAVIKLNSKVWVHELFPKFLTKLFIF